MEIRNLNTFLQVVSIKNFTQAGQTLGYSQSNVSAQIQQLEREVGAPLFNRIGRQITLTQYGEELVPYAQKIVSTALHMENFLKSKEALAGTVRIGMVESLYEILFEPAVLQYHQTYPHVKVDLIVDDTATLKEGMQMGILDFACLIAEPLPKTQWQTWYAKNESVVVIGHPDNPLSKRKSLQLADLKDEEFILMELTAPYIVHFQSIIAGQNITLHPFLTLQSADTATRLVSKGDFVSVLPLYTVRHAAGKGQVVILPVTDFQGSQYVQMVLHANKVMTPQIEGFLQEIRTVIETGQSGL
ncbi:LysR family transcriptional regulator [Megasphaera cerevisiae]|jgi:DNA-binding transcriptional LysR family regulator|uniref:LysR family transcriptional regulator n=1 Tax=Megasphaera cerevisiae TaxID=39029 RepID=UPI00065AE0F8|nr:LysR family transcriptional regulator [Megasphaera cerevisiae]SJZ79164.1 DNA-binding transcriptional regulator, LysR family [Megasphaera cerevisiae DSM 20462]